MAMNKNTLGQAIYDCRSSFSNKTTQDLIDQYGSLEAARLAACKAEAEVIINHITSNAALTVPGVGLTAPNGPVAGTSTTGTIA